MDHNGFYADLDSLNSLTNIGTNSSSFNDTTCPTLPSLNNFKYQQSSSNIYQQQAIPDLNHSTSTPLHSAKSTSSLPQTQININNCNNNIFFPHDDGLFDATQAAAAAGCASVPPNTGNTQNNNQKNNFIGYVRKEAGPNIVGGGGSGDSNITYNINNINTNIVNNINNPANLVNNGDIFGGNQYHHQINKNGETIINFTNNNLNSSGSMPTDTVTATSQNFYGYQTTNLNTNSVNNNSGNSQGQHTIYESSVQSQTQSSSSSSILDPNMGASKSMGASNVINVGVGGISSNTTGLYHGHSHHQTLNNGAYMPSTESLSAAKIINNFEAKNPLKYPTASSNRPSGSYYKGAADYPTSQYPLHPPPVNHLPPHGTNNFHIYQPTPPNNGIPQKISPTAPPHGYELYSRIPAQPTRNSVPHYPGQSHYGAPLDDPLMHNSGRVNYARTSALHPSYHHSIPPPHPVPPNNYGNYYNTNYNHPTMSPYSTYPTPQMPPYVGGPTMRNESCSKSSSNYNKTGAMALSPVDHSTFSLPPHGTTSSYATKKDFYSENHFYQHPYSHHDDPMNRSMNSCAKKSTSGHKITNDMYNPNGMNGSAIYGDHHLSHHSLQHHQQNGNVMRNAGYQPLPPPKHYNPPSAYPMPSAESLSSCEYQACNYRYKNGEIPQKVPKNPLLNAKQFKTYNHFEPPHPPSHMQAPQHYGQPQYHPSMSMKHADKIKISIDLEEQINSSKIPKMRDTTPYGYDLHYQHPAYYPYHRATRGNVVVGQNDADKIPNINISLRDFLSTWNEIDDEEEARPPHGMMDSVNGIEHMERTIMREYNPMFVQKATDNIISTTTDVPTNDKSQLENGAICEGTEKLYVLETIDVPISELNKYKHLSIINKLPENVVITDKELFTDMEMNREKLYKSEFELEFEACQEPKITKVDEIHEIPTVEIKTESDEEAEKAVAAEAVKIEATKKSENNAIKQESQNESATMPQQEKECEQQEGKKKKPLKSPKLKKVEVKVPKIKQSILKKEKILKVSKDLRKTRIAKRVRKYSLNQRASSVKTLQTICIDFLNTSTYRNYAREQLSISKKFSKMKVLKDFKKKFNFDSMKKPTPLVNQKSNHSVQVNSLREMCGRLLVDKSKLLELDGSEEEMYEMRREIPSLKELCKEILSDMNVSVVDLFTPPSLVDICENYIYNNRQYFHIEEVSNIPKLQDICKDVLSASNIFINVESNSDGNIYTLNEAIQSSEMNADGEPIYIVEENSGNVSELFESDTLNPHEKSEILKKIQRVANIDDDDEIFRAIGALHDDDDNNNSNVYNKNITMGEFSMTDNIMDGMSYMPYIAGDELFQSNVQYEEIISVNNNSDGKIKKIYEILRHKYLNRSDVRQATRTINRIMRKSLSYQRVHRFCNAQRKERIHSLIQQARCALYKLRKLSCDINIENTSSPLSSSSSSSSSSSCSSCSSSSTTSSSTSSSSSSSNEEIDENEKIMEIESQIIAKNYNNQHVEVIKGSNCEESPESPPKSLINGNLNGQADAENFPKLPTVFPSINEYKIERKEIIRSVSNQSDVKELNVNTNPNNNFMRKRKMSFDESLLNINKFYRKKTENEDVSNNGHDKHAYRSDQRVSSSTSSRNHSSRNHSYNNDRYNERKDKERRRRSRSRSRSRHYYSHSTEQRDEKASSRKSYHNSSRHDHYRKDQNNKHSEARRLILPSYKIYDKDLDVKLKVRPIVRIEREEKVDDLVKKYN